MVEATSLLKVLATCRQETSATLAISAYAQYPMQSRPSMTQDTARHLVVERVAECEGDAEL
jgi:hypothetical protein